MIPIMSCILSVVICGIVAVLLLVTLDVNGWCLSSFSNIHILNVNSPHRASQGIATDGQQLFLTSSVNEKGKPENIISVYSMDGKFIKEKRNASQATDPDGRKMEFGDATILGTNLYIAMYNWNSLPAKKSPLYSKIAVFNSTNLAPMKIFDAGGNTLEGVSYEREHFWTTFHDEPILKEFDGSLKFLKSFPLMIPSNFKMPYGYAQGITWYGNDVFVNIHGPNFEGSFYAPGILRYHYNGKAFEYVETLTAPTYGSGQGLDNVGYTFYFVDRPGNVIIRADLAEK